MSRDDVRANLASWEADSAEYQATHRSQLNRWDAVRWGTWGITDDELGALGDVRGLDALELGCGACQVGIAVAARGARVIGLDFSANQLAAAAPNMRDSGVRYPLVRASAEELPFAEASFDLVFCDHGATTFTDPHVTIHGAARVLRPGGRLVFNIATPIIAMAWGDGEDAPPDRELHRPYFELGRMVWGDSVDWQLPYGEWIRLFRANGLAIEDLIEIRPPQDATSTYDFAPLAWARDFPGEHIWKVRKEPR
ncbi:MAG TPA: class I SAM-dependent methyltransferase [Actinomycetota bacterium]|nr:class I SAM-dependent methyltransferase [Actinomycetota bacterium]